MSNHESRQTRTRLGTPTEQQGELALAEARRLFHRTLASWTSDLLTLRRSGLTRPVWNGADIALDRAA